MRWTSQNGNIKLLLIVLQAVSFSVLPQLITGTGDTAVTIQALVLQQQMPLLKKLYKETVSSAGCNADINKCFIPIKMKTIEGRLQLKAGDKHTPQITMKRLGVMC